MPKAKIGLSGNIDVHPEYLKKVLFDLLEQYEVDYQLYSPVVDIVKEGNQLTGVLIAAKEGRVTFQGKTIIDATGDGDVAYLAGCEMETQGDAETSWRPPVTVAWALCNVDCDLLFEWLEGGIELDRRQYQGFNDLIKAYREQGYNLPGWIGFNRTTLPGVVSVNSGTSLHLQLDCSQSATLTLMEKMAIDQFLNVCEATECHCSQDISEFLVSIVKRISADYSAIFKCIIHKRTPLKRLNYAFSITHNA